tara:strand:- start:97 stop:807 length:711 start_codon:yes stop_codon:yes gene_type:complete
MNKKLKVLLLSAGYGTRLRPITNKTPKCLVEINHKPLLHIWLDKLEKLDCESVLINTHFLPLKVNKSIQEWDGKNLNIYTTYEKKLLGTAGTLLRNLNFFKESKGLIIHADNFTQDDLTDFLIAHEKKPKNTLLTMLTFETDNPQNCGVVEVDNKNIVKSFHEKVSSPPTNIANGAIYAFNEDFLYFLKNIKSNPNDISKDLIPLLNGRIFTYKTNSTFIDIGTPENLQKAQNLLI